MLLMLVPVGYGHDPIGDYCIDVPIALKGLEFRAEIGFDLLPRPLGEVVAVCAMLRVTAVAEAEQEIN